MKAYNFDAAGKLISEVEVADLDEALARARAANLTETRPEMRVDIVANAPSFAGCIEIRDIRPIEIVGLQVERITGGQVVRRINCEEASSSKIKRCVRDLLRQYDPRDFFVRYVEGRRPLAGWKRAWGEEYL